MSRTWIQLALVFAAVSGACAEAVPRMAEPRDERDAAPVQDAALGDSCPAEEPEVGTPCRGDLRCRLRRHGDCSSPMCPTGCMFRGYSDNVQSSGGISYYAVCRKGTWAIFAEGACHNPASIICDCPGADAGSEPS